jgi:hypothetical protein
MGVRAPSLGLKLCTWTRIRAPNPSNALFCFTQVPLVDLSLPDPEAAAEVHTASKEFGFLYRKIRVLCAPSQARSHNAKTNTIFFVRCIGLEQ